jgi:hypothetical protein
VLAYLTVISLMVAAAAGTRGGAWRYAVLAAALFYVSDIVVADGRFVHSSIRHDLLCYPLYYGACVLLALWPLLAQTNIGVGTAHWVAPPLPPNRTGGFPASGSPVGGVTGERTDGPEHEL